MTTFVRCFSGCWYRCWAEWVISWWRRSVWRQNCVPVTSFTSHRFQRSSSTQSRWDRWDLKSVGLTDETGCGGTCQQPCSVLHLYDVGSTHESAWSVAQSTTQRHCRVTLYFPLSCHWHSRCPVTLYSPLRCQTNSPCQETHLAAVWLWTMFGVLQVCTRLAIHSFVRSLVHLRE